MNISAHAVKKSKIPRAAAKKQAEPSKNAPFADKIPFIRSLILDSVKPGVIKKIYLFGSYAYGTATEDSDIDLLNFFREASLMMKTLELIRCYVNKWLAGNKDTLECQVPNLY